MATYTSKYHLKKPDINDIYDIDDFNSNSDILDSEIENLDTGKLDKPLVDGTSGQYLTSNGTGGSVWKTFDYSYSKEDSDARYAEKGAVGEGEKKLEIVIESSLPETPKENKLYMTGAPSAADYSNYYDKQVYVEKPKALNDSYMQWSVIDYGSAGAGPAMIVTASLDVKAGDEVYGVSSGDLSVGYEIAYWTTVSSYEQGVITCENGATLGSGTITALKVTNHDSFTGRSYEQIGEKPWVTLLDYTSASSDSTTISTTEDIAGNSFSVSEIEVCWYLPSQSASYAHNFELIPNGTSGTAMFNSADMTSTGTSAQYGRLSMWRTSYNNGWVGYVERSTSLTSGSSTINGVHAFFDIGELHSFAITVNAQFSSNARFVVRGR